MGDARPKRVLLLGVAAVVVVTGAAAVAVDVVREADPPPPSPATPTAEPSANRPHERERPPVARPRERTIYDSLDYLDECTRTSGGEAAGPRLGSGVRAIARRVERIRQLEFETRVATRLLPQAEVGERFVRSFRSDLTAAEAARQERVYAALELVPEGFDLRAAAERFFGGNVSGSYDRRTRRLVVAATGGELDPFQELVLAHELDHALIDQTHGLPRTTSNDPRRGDEMLARQILAEGDATLAMARYGHAWFGADLTSVFLTRFSGDPVTPPADQPYLLVRTNEAPYFEGLLLACTLWRRGGWAAVDELYERPPASTAQVLFPARLETRREPEEPADPEHPGRGWRRSWSGSFGAFDVMLLLEDADVLTHGSARPGSHVEDVRGWAGGRLTAWVRGPRTTIHLGLVDAGVAAPSGTRRRLCGALRGWVTETFPEAAMRGTAEAHAWAWDEGAARLACRGSSVELTLGPAPRVARAVIGR